MKKTTPADMPPMECLYLGKSAAAHVAGSTPVPSRHFALKRKPKSAALRVELMQKCKKQYSIRSCELSFINCNCRLVIQPRKPLTTCAKPDPTRLFRSSSAVLQRRWMIRVRVLVKLQISAVVYYIHPCSTHARNSKQGVGEWRFPEGGNSRAKHRRKRVSPFIRAEAGRRHQTAGDQRTAARRSRSQETATTARFE